MTTKETRKLLMVTALVLVALGLPALAGARVSLEPSLPQAAVLSASALSLSSSPALASGMCRCVSEDAVPSLSAAALSLPGEVVEDVLLGGDRADAAR